MLVELTNAQGDVVFWATGGDIKAFERHSNFIIPTQCVD